MQIHYYIEPETQNIKGKENGDNTFNEQNYRGKGHIIYLYDETKAIL